MVNFRKSFRSLRFGFQGIRTLFLSENNARFHALATVAVVALGFIVSLNSSEWVGITTAIGLVWMSEAFNTALETLCDFVHPDYHPVIGKIKDLSAAAVLLASITAVIIGGIIFVPKLF